MATLPKHAAALVDLARKTGLSSDWRHLYGRMVEEADREGIGPLTDAHWAVISFVLDFHRLSGQTPAAVRIGRACHLGVRQLATLFPRGAVRTVFDLAGLPLPADLPPEALSHLWN